MHFQPSIWLRFYKHLKDFNNLVQFAIKFTCFLFHLSISWTFQNLDHTPDTVANALTIRPFHFLSEWVYSVSVCVNFSFSRCFWCKVIPTPVKAHVLQLCGRNQDPLPSTGAKPMVQHPLAISNIIVDFTISGVSHGTGQKSWAGLYVLLSYYFHIKVWQIVLILVD